MKTDTPYHASQLDAIADAWSPAVKAACAAEPPPAVIARVHARAARELGAHRRRLRFARLRPYLVSAAAVALVCATALLSLRPTTPLLRQHPLAALDGLLLLATAADDESAAESGLRSASDAEELARRLLQLQGFVDTDAETLYAYL